MYSIIILLGVLWILLEICFVYRLKMVDNELNRRTTNRTNNYKAIKKSLDIVSKLEYYSAKKFFEGFFLGADFDSIYSENMESFFAWAAYGKNYLSLNRQKRMDIELLMVKTLDKYGLNIKRGYNPDVDHVSMCLQPINYSYQPLFLYVIYDILHLMTNGFLRLIGFKRYRHGNFSYLYRDGTNKVPTVFFHGISPGWYSYLRFIMNFPKDTPVVLFELEPYRISSLDFARVKPNDVADTVLGILHNHGFSRCDVVSHSFGTIVGGWFVKRWPKTIRKLVMVDPVAILLALPDVASNFVYIKPKTWFHKVIRYFAARELTIAHSIFRNFDWGENAVWLDEIPSDIKILVSLSYADEIIPYNAIEEYLEGFNNVKLVTWDSYSHAQTLALPKKAIDKIHHMIENM